eukprot:TRINITY_DN76171_c0_g1_i1.p1 TRINITY_DN76171_c0_g1~~TRINITY_DN76171_c0_g1_i1.p1  ORF type:complete len:219 (+),score=29.85 TRINITY_DN76171_c0_g1_i1:53-709(+)
MVVASEQERPVWHVFGWMTFLNHGIFAALFIWRQMLHFGKPVEVGRSLDVEFQTICAYGGCDAQQMKEVAASCFSHVFVALGVASDPMQVENAVRWYMCLEGNIHVAMCLGWLYIVLMGGGMKLYRWSLIAELWIMDIYYTLAFLVFPYGCILWPHVCMPESTIKMIESWDVWLTAKAVMGLFTIAWLQHLSVFLDVVTYLVTPTCIPVHGNAKQKLK